jgi:hypothetical protein
MTEEFFPEAKTYKRKSAFPDRYLTTKNNLVKPCIFCEFTQDIIEQEDIAPRDEEIILFHLRNDHGLER